MPNQRTHAFIASHKSSNRVIVPMPPMKLSSAIMKRFEEAQAPLPLRIVRSQPAFGKHILCREVSF